MANPTKRGAPARKSQAAKVARAKHPGAAARVSVDRKTVIIEFLPGSGAKGRLKFDRAELARFIKFLADARLEMPSPPLSDTDFRDMEKTRAIPYHARWYADVPSDHSGSRLAFDHPGIGHVRFFFPPDALQKLVDLLTSHLVKVREYGAKS
jgi:hypothetical protein